MYSAVPLRPLHFKFLFSILALSCFVSIHAKNTRNTIERENQAFFLFLPFFTGPNSLETPLQFCATLYLNLANYNAWCNYHPTAVDIFGRSRFRRTAREHTLENKNTAAFYAMLRLYEFSPESFGTPSGLPRMRQLMRDRGLNPEDKSMNLSTPVGIGNRAGRDTYRLMFIDGWNALGQFTSSQPHYAQPFADFTAYIPKNDPWRIKFPFRWQPLLENNGEGFFFRQEHVSPQAGSALLSSISPLELRNRRVKSPYRKRNAKVGKVDRRDIVRLKKDARKVFKKSARLTEKQRVLAEFFDNKILVFRSESSAVRGIAAAFRYSLIGPTLDLSADREVFFGLGSNLAGYQAIVTAWKEKRRIDAIRPTGQTMEFLFGKRKFEVWGGPRKRNVRITAGEWIPYLRTMPHSEFPSASACICEVAVEHGLEETNGLNSIPYTATIPKGTSRFYPGQIPSEDYMLKIDNLTDWSKLCGLSRLYAGVHFEAAVAAGKEVCKGIGTSSHKFVESLVVGKPDLSWLDWLPSNIERFWEEE